VSGRIRSLNPATLDPRSLAHRTAYSFSAFEPKLGENLRPMVRGPSIPCPRGEQVANWCESIASRSACKSYVRMTKELEQGWRRWCSLKKFETGPRVRCKTMVEGT